MGSGRSLDPVALEFARLLRERLGPRVREVVLFGSRARGDARGSLVACLLRDEREWEASRRMPIGLNVAREGSSSLTPEAAHLGR